MRFPLLPPPGIQMDNTTFSAEGAWWDCDKVRFWRDRAQVIGGWEPFGVETLNGVCRTIYPWRDRQSGLLVGFGTNAALEVFYSGEIADITPTLKYPPIILSSNPLTATSGSDVIEVSQPGHGLTTGDSVTVSGSGAVGNLTPNGTFTITVIGDDSYSFIYSSNASATTLSNDPMTATNASKVVTVSHPAHGLTSGATVVISGATPFAGITPNGTFQITVIDSDTYSFVFTSAATSAASGGGAAVSEFVKIAGGNAVRIDAAGAWQPGAVDGAGGAGFGAGQYGVGYYGEPSEVDFFPLTWSLSSYGESLMANPRGGTIYWWQNDPLVPAAPLLNAPRQVTFTLVTPQRQVLAFGCNEEASGVFNPLCIRGSDIEDPESWAVRTDNNAFEYVLESGGRIVAARVNAYGIFVWTDNAVYQGTFLGDPGQTFRFDKLGPNCGLIGPNAAVVAGQTAFWIGQDRQFYSCSLGGVPQIISSPVQREFADYLASGQQDKIVAATIAQFGEVWWFYPDERDTVPSSNGDIIGLENSRYLSLSYLGQGWARGNLSRTAFVDASPAVSPLAADVDGNTFYHERGQYGSTGPIDWYLESADYYFGEGDQTLEIQSVWPDFENQVGPISLTITTRLYPQGQEYLKGPYSLSPNRGKRDFRASGRVARIKISSDASPSYARLGKIEFEGKTRGLR